MLMGPVRARSRSPSHVPSSAAPRAVAVGVTFSPALKSLCECTYRLTSRFLLARSNDCSDTDSVAIWSLTDLQTPASSPKRSTVPAGVRVAVPSNTRLNACGDFVLMVPNERPDKTLTPGSPLSTDIKCIDTRAAHTPTAQSLADAIAAAAAADDGGSSSDPPLHTHTHSRLDMGTVPLQPTSWRGEWERLKQLIIDVGTGTTPADATADVFALTLFRTLHTFSVATEPNTAGGEGGGRSLRFRPLSMIDVADAIGGNIYAAHLLAVPPVQRVGASSLPAPLPVPVVWQRSRGSALVTALESKRPRAEYRPPNEQGKRFRVPIYGVDAVRGRVLVLLKAPDGKSTGTGPGTGTQLVVWSVDTGTVVRTVLLPLPVRTGHPLSFHVVDDVALVVSEAAKTIEAVQLPPEVFS
jgi:hypothetical protein